jgi:tetratricopeptide (TPR) repeat protein
MMESRGKFRPQSGDAAVSGSNPQLPPVQLGLFGQNDMTLFNRGIQAFNNLELEKAVDFFQKHRSIYPRSCDISSRLKAAQFLLNGLKAGPVENRRRPGYLWRLWHSFEEHVESEDLDFDVEKLRSSFFSSVLTEVERAGLGGSPWIPHFEDKDRVRTVSEAACPNPLQSRIPLGCLFLRAGRYDEAIRSLQECITQMPRASALYGWLGDACLLRGDSIPARQYYREACFIGPASIDWRHIADADLKQLLEDILLYYDFNPEVALEWLPSHARIEGLFERKAVRIHDGLQEYVDDYLATEEAFFKEKSSRLAAKLFLRGIVLCENSEDLQSIRKIDAIKVRKTMKLANPDLFEDFLERIIGKGHA